MAETQILRPIGVDSYTLISGSSQYCGTPKTGSNLYQNVDESSKNEADYNYGLLVSAGQQVYDILYTLEEYTGSNSINKVTVKGYYYLYEYDSPTFHSQARFRIKSGGTVYNGSYFDPSTSAYGLHSKAYTTNPKTSAAWTKEEVNALLAGDSLGAYTSTDKYPKISNARCCQYWVEVEYEAAPDPPTNVAASENDSSKVVVTWTKSAGATGYKVYRDTVLIDTLGDVATYDDTGADAPVITPGSAAASDGISTAYVTLLLSGHSIANGTTHSYTVKATNASGDSAASSADTGYRLAGTLTYQWQRSAGDSDADYSNIEGGTTASYNDTGAPSNGDGRYFKCVLSATGSSNQTSSADRGYRTALTSPTVTTAAASNVDETSFTGNGEITSTGGANPFRRGFCWIEGAVGDPDVNDSVEDETGDFGTGVFDLSITGLSSETDYRVRAFAENSVGISYSDTIDVTTLSRAIETEACTNVTSESATANATINRSTNAVVRRGFVYRKASSGDPLITDLNATVISEETKSGIDGLVLRKYNGDLEEDGYFTLDDIIDLGAVYTVRAHGILTTTSLNLYDDLYSYTDLFAVLNLYGVNEGKTNVVIEISTTNDDTTADPEWSDWQTFIIGDYSARGFRFRLYAKGLPPDITPIIYSAYIELDMEDRVYSFEETVTAGGITIEFDPPFYAAPHIGISILDAQSGDYYVIDAKDENGFNVEIFNGVTSVERAISGIARGYGMKEV